MLWFRPHSPPFLTISYITLPISVTSLPSASISIYNDWFNKCSLDSVQSLNCVWLFVTPVDCSTPGCPGPSPISGVYSNSCPLSQWCHPTVSSSVVPFPSCLQSFPASESFPVSWLFPSGGQSIGVSASASVLPVNIQDWFPLGWTGWISLQSKGLKNLLQHHSSKVSILWHSAFFMVQLSHPYVTTGKIITD